MPDRRFFSAGSVEQLAFGRRPGPGLSVAAGLRFDWQNYFGDTGNWSQRLALA
jgi:hypothetical protein